MHMSIFIHKNLERMLQVRVKPAIIFGIVLFGVFQTELLEISQIGNNDKVVGPVFEHALVQQMDDFRKCSDVLSRHLAVKRVVKLVHHVP